MDQVFPKVVRFLRKTFAIIGKGFLFKISLPIGLIVILVLSSGFASAYTIKRNPDIIGLLKGPADIEKEERDFIAEVGRNIALPQGEKPTIAIVSEPDKLTNQAFFKNAKKGDKVLIFTNAKKAILYRPSERRVVDVGSVSIDQQNQVAAAESNKFVLYNGIGTAGLTNVIEDKIKKIIPEAEIVAKGNAKEQNYKKTIIIDLTDQNKDSTQKIAKDLNIEVSTLPVGETKPSNADYLVIVGEDLILPASTPAPTSTPNP